METNRLEQIAIAKRALMDVPFWPHGKNNAEVFEPGWQTLSSFVEGTWVGDLTDELFEHAAIAVVDALTKEPT